MPAPDRRRVRPGVERLEDRAVPAADFAPGRVLVTYADAGDHLGDLRITPISASATRLTAGVYAVALAPGAAVSGAADALARLPGVKAAGPDYRVMPEAVPNDPKFAQQWGDAVTNAAAAWSVSTGTGNTVVAVIDTGVDTTHPDLAPNLWRNPGEVPANGRDDDGDGFVDDVYGVNFQTNTGVVADDAGHGTHVAGIAGAAGGNGLGVAGVLWHTRLMPLKFMGAGGGLTSDAVRAVDYAVTHGAKVINASWGGGSADAALDAAFARARAAGVVVVTAAGNEGRNTDATPFYPANAVTRLDNVVSVAATTSRDALAPFSNYGAATVTLAAPGEGVLSTLRGGGYGTMSGTSMAAPFVAGAVGLLWDAHPTWSYQQVLAKLRQSVDTLPALAGKTATGGRLNLAKLLDAQAPPPTVDRTGPRVTSAAVTGPAGTLTQATVGFSEPMDPATLTRSVAIGTPGGAVVFASTVAPVAGTNDTQFTATFARPLTTTGWYTLTVSYLAHDSAGNGLDQNGNGVNGETTDWFTVAVALPPPAGAGGAVTVAAAGLPRAIADRRTTRVELTVDRDLTVAGLAVRLDAAHARTSDLSIRLTSPAGRKVTLFNRRSGANLSGVTFADAGPVRPEQPLAAFDGANARGVWVLEIFDLADGADGTLSGVALDFTARV